MFKLHSLTSLAQYSTLKDINKYHNLQKSLPELYINQIATFKRIKYTCVMSIVYHKEWLELNRQSTKEQIDNYLKNNRTKIPGNDHFQIAHLY